MSEHNWEETFSLEESFDAIAISVRNIQKVKGLLETGMRALSSIEDVLIKDRKSIIREMEKRFSDTWSAIDVYQEASDENSWDTFMRILNHYKETYRKEI